MKIRFLLLALLMTSAASFAQTTFTKATLEGILKEYQKDPPGFFERYCSPDFRYIATDGLFKFLPELLKGSVGSKVSANDIQEQKIIQSGDVAVVSGIHVVDRIAANGTRTTTRTPCTYTFQRQKGNISTPQWKFVASQHTAIVQNQSGQTSTDEARSEGRTPDVSAIKKVIRDETDGGRYKDFSRWLNCYAKLDDVVFGFYPGMTRGYDELVKAGKASFEKNPQPRRATSILSDYRIRQQGTTAFVSCLEVETLADSTQTRVHKALYLEKQNGEWKIVGNLFSIEPSTKPK